MHPGVVDPSSNQLPRVVRFVAVAEVSRIPEVICDLQIHDFQRGISIEV